MHGNSCWEIFSNKGKVSRKITPGNGKGGGCKVSAGYWDHLTSL